MTKTAPRASAAQDPSRPASILDELPLPEGLRNLPLNKLNEVADAVRREMIDSVSVTGGHLGAGLGVVELTVALHATFNTPHDRLIWDVGHQAYPHKILTGRRDRMKTLRQGGGLSGFTKRSESVYDPFGAAHSSTSISAGLGMAVARDLANRHNKVIAVIGDGSITAGMAYEAMNNAGDLKSDLLVILNDNDMSIAPPVGALSHHLTKLVSSRPYVEGRHFAKRMAEHLLPAPLQRAAAKAEETVRAAMGEGSLFEALGFYYMGPVDGHDLAALLPILQNWRDTPNDKPVLLHVRTQKGKGYPPAEGAADKMHGVTTFDIATGQQSKPAPNLPPSYTKVFAQQLCAEAEKDDKIVAITAAMPSGTGLDMFAKAFPSRCFDVGIAEQHAVTFAAGLATEGFKPFVAIYSSFLQRAYDQIVHDVAMQNLPVRFAIDRAGLVGADGYTHAGAFDTTYLACLPNMTLMAAADEVELARMVATAARYNDGPIALRYPRGNGTGAEFPKTIAPIAVGKGRILQEGTDVALLSYGTRLSECEAAAAELQSEGLSVTIADARFAKPLDTQLVDKLITSHKLVITVEEGAQGGFGAIVLQHAAQAGLLDSAKNARLRCLTLPDLFQDHDTPAKQYAAAKLDAASIATAVRRAL